MILSGERNRCAIRKLVARACINRLRPENRDKGVLLHTSHNGMEFQRYYNAMDKRGLRSVFMVHDLIPLTHAEFCRPGVDAAHRKRIHTALAHADGLIANSQDTLDVLAAEASQANLPLPANVVARLAPAITARTPHPAPIAQPYFVVLGTIEPRKNHWFLLQVWRRLVEHHGVATPKLVVIGRRGWECENAVDMLDRCTQLQDTVIELHGCSDEELRTWIQHAQALLFPSFVEGYGMPLVEALALGVPLRCPPSRSKRGVRTLNWLAGRSGMVWCDSIAGRIALAFARLTGLHCDVAWQSPLWAREDRHAVPLAWFSVPDTAASPATFARAIDDALARHPDAGSSPDVARLMARVRVVRALDHAQRTPPGSLQQARATAGERVLFIDERASSSHDSRTARARSAAFARMVSAARGAYPQAQFYVVRSGANGRGRWLSEASRSLRQGFSIADVESTACAAIDQVTRVYTLAAPEGLHALLVNVPLHVFGAPWYAGWGLTQDAKKQTARKSRPTLAALFDIVFLRFGRYLDPATHAPGSLDALLDSLELQRQVAARFDALGNVAGVRFQWWKRPFATPYLGASGHALRWAGSTAEVAPHECAALWGARSAEGLADGVRHIRIEDGFLHSLGLGSDMNAPHSQYNLGRRSPQWRAPAAKRVVLVPGQVADDASIRLGTRAISTADVLLKEVRSRRPDAFIVYKPHPDVMSGNRNGLIDAHRLADVVDTEADVLSLIEVSDEVHTLSSLAGFDALLRGKEVHTYGMPFYAGWGLTHDALAPLPWRERTLTLDMLTAGALLRYPLYWDWHLGLFTTPEAVAARLAPGAARPLRRVQGDRLRVWLKAKRWSRNVLAHWIWRARQRHNS
ncbi:capsule polysaccharide biosynthesis protein [Necator americanus]|uniref:Capsule polysaccharide biosynthesis protein n=1 Tax=Necator americanus TaxID=51031 RepID=W2U0N3_NECAM|nr:capsule polysaccharide biosynthesis protein [Necator americanus]ETN86862.1 capsule polysaccharide biosynthesis protein [Necator americanus]